MAIGQSQSHVSESEQVILKKSRDDKYDVLAFEMLGENNAGNAVLRVKVNDDGSLVTNEKETTDFEGAPVTVGTTAVEMSFAGTTQSVMIQSDPDNTGIVWVGKSNVTNAGANAMVQLEPGDSVSMDLNDSSNAIYSVSDTASQNVFKMALL